MKQEMIERNGVEIDPQVAENIKRKVLMSEGMNSRTKAKGDSAMVNEHMKTIEEETNVYQAD